MEILNFGDNSSSRKKRSNRAILAVAALVVGVVGSTFAANISINNSPVEYGQGVAQTTACDSSITVAPLNTFANASGAGSFKLSTIQVYDTTTATGTPNVGLAGCASKYLKVSAWDSTGSSTLLSCDIQLGTYTNNTSGFSATTIANSSCTGNGTAAVAQAAQLGGSSYTNKDGFVISFTSPTIDASGIYKFTVESHV